MPFNSTAFKSLFTFAYPKTTQLFLFNIYPWNLFPGSTTAGFYPKHFCQNPKLPVSIPETFVWIHHRWPWSQNLCLDPPLLISTLKHFYASTTAGPLVETVVWIHHCCPLPPKPLSGSTIPGPYLRNLCLYTLLLGFIPKSLSGSTTAGRRVLYVMNTESIH